MKISKLEEYTNLYYDLHQPTGKLLPKLIPDQSVPILTDDLQYNLDQTLVVSSNLIPMRFPLDIVIRMEDRTLYDKLQTKFVEFLAHLSNSKNSEIDVVAIRNPLMIFDSSNNKLFWTDPSKVVKQILDAIATGKRIILIELIYHNMNRFHQNVVVVTIVKDTKNHDIMYYVEIERFDPNGWASATFWNGEFDLKFAAFIYKVEYEIQQIDPSICVTLKSPYSGCPYLGPQPLAACETLLPFKNIGLCALWSIIYVYLKLLPQNVDKSADDIFKNFYQDLEFSRNKICLALLGFLEYGLYWRYNTYPHD
jgi:hypothetical protein